MQPSRMTESVGFGITFNPQHLEEDEDEVTPCIPYSSRRTQSGPINPWTLCRLIDDGKIHSVFNNFCHGLELMNEGGRFVTFSAHFVFEWKQMKDINKLTYFPYKVITRLYEVQQPCVRTVDSLINMVNGKSIVKCFSENILIEIRSRRQKLLPFWFTDDYKSFNGVDNDRAFAKQALSGTNSVPDVPTSPHPICLTVSVLESETDSNKVLHKDAFIRYTFECVDYACRQKRFPYLGTSLSELHLCELSVCYHGDAFLGDNLTMLCWQCERPDVLWCVMKKFTSIIFTSKMTFDLSSQSC